MTRESESWLIEAGDRAIRAAAEAGGTAPTPWAALVRALWWADYAMRNGEALAAADAASGFHAAGRVASDVLQLPLTRRLFALDLSRFEAEYLDRFEAVCSEVRAAEPGAAADGPRL